MPAFLKCLKLLRFLALLAAALSITCGVDGPNVIEGREANARLRAAIYGKLLACDVTFNSALLFSFNAFTNLSTTVGTFRAGAYYDQGDVDRCLNDFNAMPCESFNARDPDDSSTQLLLVGQTPCRGIQENFFVNNPAGQGKIL